MDDSSTRTKTTSITGVIHKYVSSTQTQIIFIVMYVVFRPTLSFIIDFCQGLWEVGVLISNWNLSFYNLDSSNFHVAERPLVLLVTNVTPHQHRKVLCTIPRQESEFKPVPLP